MHKLFFLSLLLALCSAQIFSQSRSLTINQLSWLTGCWQRETPTLRTDEQWMKPGGNTMMGMSRTVKNGNVLEYEFLQLVQDSAGAVHYVAKPSRQPEASFKLVRWNENELVFENPEHDFPQRIIYRMADADSLIARIEGTSKGKERGVDYRMARIPCE